MSAPVAAVAHTALVHVAMAAPAGDGDALALECARLRSTLDRVNLEVSALKRGTPGVGHDYRLRAKMAEAEAIARRLTEAEAELRRRRGQGALGPAAAPAPMAPPIAEPTDAPAVLEAKADILSDQARRLATQAAALDRAALQLRNRETLRRRAGQMDRDPFASLDASKRFMFVQGAGRGSPTTFGDPSKRASGPASDSATARGSATPTNPTPTVAPGAAPGPGPAPPAPPTGPSPPPPTNPEGLTQPPAPGGVSVGPTGPITPPASSGPAGRAFLDPAALAELRRLEAGGQSLSEPEKLERAAAALQQRARALEADARALRARASKP